MNSAAQKKKLDKIKENKRDSVHSFHKYFGKILPAIAEWAILEFSDPGDLVFDPFSGSGTVGLEAILNDRDFVGTEINPLSVWVASAKTNYYDIKKYSSEVKNLKENYRINDNVPFVYNAEHWFDEINLKRIKSINDSINDITSKKIRTLLLALSSSLVRNVSYADPSHVFPGKSKRMVKKISEGYVAPDFSKLFFKKAESLPNRFPKLFTKHSAKAKIINDYSYNIPKYTEKSSVGLIVTNPPYISSIRYEEATKLEVYAMEVVKSQAEFLDFGKKFSGTEKHGKKMLDINPNKHVKKYVDKMDDKAKNTVTRFFVDIEKTVKAWQEVLKLNGKVVIKIGDSVLSKTKVPTAEVISKIAQDNGFKQVHMFKDKIGSRSFTSFRNSYSGIIIYDNILVLEKVKND